MSAGADPKSSQDAENEDEGGVQEIQLTRSLLTAKFRKDASWAAQCHAFGPVYLLSPTVPVAMAMFIIVYNYIVVHTATLTCVQPLHRASPRVGRRRATLATTFAPATSPSSSPHSSLRVRTRCFAEYLQANIGLAFILLLIYANQMFGIVPFQSWAPLVVFYNVWLLAALALSVESQAGRNESQLVGLLQFTRRWSPRGFRSPLSFLASSRWALLPSTAAQVGRRNGAVHPRRALRASPSFDRETPHAFLSSLTRFVVLRNEYIHFVLVPFPDTRSP